MLGLSQEQRWLLDRKNNSASSEAYNCIGWIDWLGPVGLAELDEVAQSAGTHIVGSDVFVIFIWLDSVGLVLTC